MIIEPLIQLPTVWSGVANRLGVHLFEGKLSVHDMDQLEAIGTRWRGTNQLKVVELVVIFPSDSKMTTYERQRMANLIKRFERFRTASSTVLLAPGLVGTMHRAVLVGLQFLAPPPHPMKIYRSLTEALDWLAPYVQEVNGTAEGLHAAVARFCDAFKARGQS
jgi:hypothetical protein